MDVEAWKQFSYVFGKYIRKNFIPRPVWPESFIDAMEIVGKVLKTQGREITVEGNRITVRITDCETQKAIAKAGAVLRALVWAPLEAHLGAGVARVVVCPDAALASRACT